MKRRGFGQWVRTISASIGARLDGLRGAVALGLSAVLLVMLPAAATAAPTWVAPVNAPIWGGFKEPSYHHGVDLGAQRWVPIRAASAGTVITSKCNASLNGEPYSCDIDGSPDVKGCGWYIDIAHADGVVTRYCHMVVKPLVGVGDKVEAGQRVGYVGSSGNSSAPHLHFEVHLVPEGDYPHNGNAIDPVPFMAKRGAPLGVGNDKPQQPADAPTATETAPPPLADGRSDVDGDGLTDLVVWNPIDGQWQVRLAADILAVAAQASAAAEANTGAEASTGADPAAALADDSSAAARAARVADALAAQEARELHGPATSPDPDSPDDADPGTASPESDPAAGEPQPPVALGGAGDVPVVADYDGDGRDDLAVWRSADGAWLVQASSGAPVTEVKLGGPGDMPVPGDYDGNGFADFAVWRPSTGEWLIHLNTGTGEPGAPADPVVFGQPGDLPVVADYDGDGRDDLAVWRPVGGQWLVQPSGEGEAPTATLGAEGDIPVPGDFDGDGRADFSVWRPVLGVWTVTYTSGAAAEPVAVGQAGDEPVVGDYDGDGRDDLALWRRAEGQWLILPSSGERLTVGEPGTGIVFGRPGDQPANRPLWLDENGKPPVLGKTLLRERIHRGAVEQLAPAAEG